MPWAMQRLLFIAFGAVFMMGLLAASLEGRKQDDAAEVAATADDQTEASDQTSRNRKPGKSARHNAWVDQTEIERDASGQFRTEVKVNGQGSTFLIDTGADLVALTTAEAQRLGLNVDRASFRAVGRSASGTAMGMPVTLERIEVAGQEIDNVQAVILEGLQTNLLGQSALRKLGKVELQGDTMVISRS